jgi:hypothetical protein
MSQQQKPKTRFFDDLRLVFNLIRDPQSPILLKLLPLAGLIYFIAPEWVAFPPFSWILASPLDDMAVFYGIFRAMVNLAPAHLIAKYRDGIEADIVDAEYSIADEVDLENDIYINPDKLK